MKGFIPILNPRSLPNLGSINESGRISISSRFIQKQGLQDYRYYKLWFDRKTYRCALELSIKPIEGAYTIHLAKVAYSYIEIAPMLKQEGFNVVQPGRLTLKWEASNKAIVIDLKKRVK